MKIHRITFHLVAALLLAAATLATLFTSTAAADPPHYNIVDLGTVFGAGRASQRLA